MNKVIGEFLSNQQPYPQFMATVVYKVSSITGTLCVNVDNLLLCKTLLLNQNSCVEFIQFQTRNFCLFKS